MVIINEKYYFIIKERVGRGEFKHLYVSGKVGEFKNLNISFDSRLELEIALKNKLDYKIEYEE